MNKDFLSGGSCHAHESKAPHLFLQTRAPLTQLDIWMCLKLKVSDSPVKTSHLSAGQMLSKAFLHLSVAKRSRKEPQGIWLLPIAAFIKHFVSHCLNTNCPCSCIKGAQIFELSPAIDILSTNLLKDDRRPTLCSTTHTRYLWREQLRFYPCFSCVWKAKCLTVHENLPLSIFPNNPHTPTQWTRRGFK